MDVFYPTSPFKFQIENKLYATVDSYDILFHQFLVIMMSNCEILYERNVNAYYADFSNNIGIRIFKRILMSWKQEIRRSDDDIVGQE